MSSMFSSLFSRDPSTSFAYNLNLDDGAFEMTESGIGIANTYKKAAPDEKATCFMAPKDSRPGTFLKTSIAKLRQLRHPNMLTFLDSLETEKSMYLMTEVCQPLAVYMRATKLTDTQRENYVLWGLQQLLNGLKFLHNDVKLSHNRIRTSIYVTKPADWTIGGFEASELFRSTKEDLSGLLAIIWDVFNDGFDLDVDNQRRKQPGKIPKSLQKMCIKLLKNPAATSADDLLEQGRQQGGCFRNKFVDMMLFLDEFQLKDSREKFAFFSHMKDHMDMLPDDVAKYKVLPRLIQAFEFGDAGAAVLTPLLHIGSKLDTAEYQTRVVPCIVKLFGSPDRATRVKLLEKLPEFVQHLTPAIVNEKLFSNVCMGFMDTNPAVRESTIKAVVVLAPKLNSQNLDIELMKHFARLQGKDDQGPIRTNTTICLGKIACYIAPANRQKILISAFSRAMKDPFAAARMAAVLAVTATQQYYHMGEVANRILPALAPLTVDDDKQVRDQAFKSIHGFVEKLEKVSDNPELLAEYEAQVMAGSSSKLSADKVPQWASWALGAISGKFYKTATPPPTAEGGASASSPATSPSTETRPSGAIANKLSNTARSKLGSASSAKPAANSDDGWGAMDDIDDDDEDAGWGNDIQSSGHKPSNGVSKSNINKWDEEDDDDEAWGAIDNVPDEKPSRASTAAPAAKTSSTSSSFVSATSNTTTSAASKPSAGKLKLKSSAKPLKSSVNDEDALLSDLLGETSMDGSLSAKLVKSALKSEPAVDLSVGTAVGPTGPIRGSKLEAKMKQKQQQQTQPKASDGWDDDQGWEAEVADPGMDSARSGGGGGSGWDSSGWGDEEESKSSKQAKLRERQEQRKRELAAKKTGGGAMKMGAKKL